MRIEERLAAWQGAAVQQEAIPLGFLLAVMHDSGP
jgi:hypothetical protein